MLCVRPWLTKRRHSTSRMRVLVKHNVQHESFSTFRNSQCNEEASTAVGLSHRATGNGEKCTGQEATSMSETAVKYTIYDVFHVHWVMVCRGLVILIQERLRAPLDT